MKYLSVAIAALCALQTPALAGSADGDKSAVAPYDYKGIKLGDTLEKVKNEAHKSGMLAKQNHYDENTFDLSADNKEDSHLSFAGLVVRDKGKLHFREGRLELMTFDVEKDSFKVAQDALEQKYGKPTDTGVREASWRNGVSLVNCKEQASETRITYSFDELAKKSEGEKETPGNPL